MAILETSFEVGRLEFLENQVPGSPAVLALTNKLRSKITWFG